MHGSRWRREETSTSRASTAARSGRLSPTLPVLLALTTMALVVAQT
jgi:hypothetical protein